MAKIGVFFLWSDLFPATKSCGVQTKLSQKRITPIISGTIFQYLTKGVTFFNPPCKYYTAKPCFGAAFKCDNLEAKFTGNTTAPSTTLVYVGIIGGIILVFIIIVLGSV